MFSLKKYWQKLLILSFGHGLNDFAAGYMLGNLLYLNTEISTVILAFTLYNILAFGGQYFVTHFTAKVAKPKIILSFAAIGNVIAILLFGLNPLISLAIAGIASAIYHVTGGSVCTKENKAAGIGIFAAPGIVGLVMAGYLAYLEINVWMQLLVVAIAFVFILQMLHISKTNCVKRENSETKISIDNHDILMILLLGVISLRSALWNIFQIIHEQNFTWLIAIAASAFVGKIIGGFISDKIGWKLYNIISVVTAMPLVTFFKEEIILFCIGVGILQSAIPANTIMMINYCRGQKEKGIALSLGLSVFIGLAVTTPVNFISTEAMISFLLFFLIILGLVFINNPFRRMKRIKLFISPAKR